MESLDHVSKRNVKECAGSEREQPSIGIVGDSSNSYWREKHNHIDNEIYNRFLGGDFLISFANLTQITHRHQKPRRRQHSKPSLDSRIMPETDIQNNIKRIFIYIYIYIFIINKKTKTQNMYFSFRESSMDQNRKIGLMRICDELLNNEKSKHSFFLKVGMKLPILEAIRGMLQQQR